MDYNDYIVIQPKDYNEEHGIVKMLRDNNVKFDKIENPRLYANNRISVNVLDGVTFTLSNAPCHWYTNELTSYRGTRAQYEYDTHMAFEHALQHRLGAVSRSQDMWNRLPCQHGYLQPLDDTFTGWKDDGYGAQQMAIPPSSLDEIFEEYAAENVDTSRNDALSMEPSTSTGVRQPMEGTESSRYTGDNHQSHPQPTNKSNKIGSQQCDYIAENMGIGSSRLSMGPSTSKPKRSQKRKRNQKRKMNDKDSNEQNDYANQAKNPRNEDSLKLTKCQKCDKTFPIEKLSSSIVRSHATMHGIPGNKKIFKCPKEGCKYWNTWMYGVRNHFEYLHSDCQLLEADFCMTPREKMAWMEHVKECFPDVDKIQRKRCKRCRWLFHRSELRQHAAESHIEGFKYKCNWPECDFSDKRRSPVKQHKVDEHGLHASIEESRIYLTFEQYEEINNMTKLCFSDEE